MTKHDQKRIEKATRKMTSRKKEDGPKGRTAAIILLILMLFSIIGFATLGNTGSGSGNTNDEGIPENLPFQQFDYQGQIFWVAVLNYEVFQFETIDGFEENLEMANLASQIKPLTNLEIFVDTNFTSGDTQYLIEKYAVASKKAISYQQNLSCSPNTLVLTNNKSYDGCLVFKSANEEAYINAQTLMYHLVK